MSIQTVVGMVNENTVDDNLLPRSVYTVDSMPKGLGAGTLELAFNVVHNDRSMRRVDANHIAVWDYSSDDACMWWVADEPSAAWFTRRFMRAVNCWHDLYAVGSEFHFVMGDTETEQVYDIHFKFVGYSPDGDPASLKDNSEAYLYGQAAINNPAVTLK